jgi:hypothetical protein
MRATNGSVSAVRPSPIASTGRVRCSHARAPRPSAITHDNHGRNSPMPAQAWPARLIAGADGRPSSEPIVACPISCGIAARNQSKPGGRNGGNSHAAAKPSASQRQRVGAGSSAESPAIPSVGWSAAGSSSPWRRTPTTRGRGGDGGGGAAGGSRRTRLHRLGGGRGCWCCRVDATCRRADGTSSRMPVAVLRSWCTNATGTPSARPSAGIGKR